MIDIPGERAKWQSRVRRCKNGWRNISQGKAEKAHPQETGGYRPKAEGPLEICNHAEAVVNRQIRQQRSALHQGSGGLQRWLKT